MKESLTFADKIVEQDSDFFTGRLHIDFVFINILFEGIMDICTGTLFESNEVLIVLTKIAFKETFVSCYKRAVFCF